MRTLVQRREERDIDADRDFETAPAPGKLATSARYVRRGPAAEDPFQQIMTRAQPADTPYLIAHSLPYLDQIQRSFGRHDVRGIEAHTGAAADAANRELGALGFAVGNQVAFRGTPSLHTAAHEAAHVVQRASGVNLKSSGGASDASHEQQADAAADAVVQGKSAEAILDGSFRDKGETDDPPTRFLDPSLDKALAHYSQAWLGHAPDWTPTDDKKPRKPMMGGDSPGSDITGYPAWFNELQNALISQPAPGAPAATAGAAAKPATAAPDTSWNAAYGKHMYYGWTYEQYRDSLALGPTSTKAPGTQRVRKKPVTEAQLFYIYPDLAKDSKDEAVHAKATRYLESCNRAFVIMQIDTLEAQALYLAHGAGESGEFSNFTESSNPTGTKYQETPHEITAASHGYYDSKGYGSNKDINPDGQYGFVGHGPVQVTYKQGHVQALAVLERQADQYHAQGDAESLAREAELREAVAAIKKNPEEAGNPKYTFLLSAGFMISQHGDTKTATGGKYSFDGLHQESNWVSGTAKDAQGDKKKGAYDRAIEKLGEDADPIAAPPAAQGGGKPAAQGYVDPLAKPGHAATPWSDDCAAVHEILEAYLRARTKKDLGGRELPANVEMMMGHLGKSRSNGMSGDFVATAPTSEVNTWCGSASYMPVIWTLKEHGLRPIGGADVAASRLVSWVKGKPGRSFGAPASYTEKLDPGDVLTIVGQIGPAQGHVVTVVQDFGSDIEVISGNAMGGGGAVRVEKIKRETPPADYKWNDDNTKQDLEKQRSVCPTPGLAPDQSVVDPGQTEQQAQWDDYIRDQQACNDARDTTNKDRAKAAIRPKGGLECVFVVVVTKTSQLDANALVKETDGMSDKDLAEKYGLERYKQP